MCELFSTAERTSKPKLTFYGVSRQKHAMEAVLKL